VKEDKGKIVGISGILKGNYTFLVVKRKCQGLYVGLTARGLWYDFKSWSVYKFFAPMNE